MPSGCGTSGMAGWTAENYIALTSSFVRVTNWKEQLLTVIGPDSGDEYHLHSDGTFEVLIGDYKGECPASVIRPKEGFCDLRKGVILRKDRIFLLQLNKVPDWSEIPFDAVLFIDGKTNRLCHHFYLSVEEIADECARDI